MSDAEEYADAPAASSPACTMWLQPSASQPPEAEIAREQYIGIVLCGRSL